MSLSYPKSRDEWLNLRHSLVCSTESSALFGMCPYMTALELGVSKQSPTYTDFEASERMSWGLVLQRAIATQIARNYGVKVKALNGFASRNRMGASFDYQIVGEDETKVEDEGLRVMYRDAGPGVLEIKNVDGLIYRNQWHDEEAPGHIEIQVQHQLHAIGWKWGALGVLVGGNKLELLIRRYDEDAGNSIEKKVALFWHELEQGRLPPANLPADADIIKKLYHYAEPGKVADLQKDEELTVLCKTIVEANARIKEATDAKESAQAQIILKIGDAEKALWSNGSIGAAMVAETEIKAYLRKAYRSIRVYAKKEKV